MLLVPMFTPQQAIAGSGSGGEDKADIRANDVTGIYEATFTVTGTAATSSITYETIGWQIGIDFGSDGDKDYEGDYYDSQLSGKTGSMPVVLTILEIFEELNVPNDKYKLGGTMYFDAIQVVKKGDDVISPEYRDAASIIAAQDWDATTEANFESYYDIDGDFPALSVTSDFTLSNTQYANVPISFSNDSYATGTQIANYKMEIKKEGTTIETFTSDSQVESYLNEGLDEGSYALTQTVDNYDGTVVNNNNRDLIFDEDTKETSFTLEPLKKLTAIEKAPKTAGFNESYIVTGEYSIAENGQSIIAYRHQRSIGDMNDWTDVSTSESFSDSYATEELIYYRVMVKQTDGTWSDWSVPVVIEITDDTPTSVNAELNMPSTVYEGVEVSIDTIGSSVTYGDETLSASNAVSRGIADYDFDFSCNKSGSLTPSGGKVSFEGTGYQTAEFELETSMDSDIDREVFNIIGTPYITNVLKGSRKVNRKLTCDFNNDYFHEDYPISLSNSYVKVIDLQNGQTATFNSSKTNTTYIKGRTFVNNEISFIIKQIGSYKVIKHAEDTRGHSDTEEITIEIVDDVAPVAQLNLMDEYYRDETGIVNINVKKEGYSPDLDMFQTDSIYYRIDTNNNGLFTDEVNIGFSSNLNEYNKIFSHNKVGKVEFTYLVRENYDTLSEYVTIDDFLSNQIVKIVDINNYAPYTALEIITKYDVDLKVVGDTSDTINSMITNMTNNITSEKAVSFNLLETEKLDIYDTSELTKIKEFTDNLAGYFWDAYEVLASTNEIALYKRYTVAEPLSYGRYSYSEPEYVGRNITTGQIKYILDEDVYPQLLCLDALYHRSFEKNNTGIVTWDYYGTKYAIDINTGQMQELGNIEEKRLGIMENLDVQLADNELIKNVIILQQDKDYAYGRGYIYSDGRITAFIYYVLKNSTEECKYYIMNKSDATYYDYIGCKKGNIYFSETIWTQPEDEWVVRTPRTKGTVGNKIHILNENNLNEFSTITITEGNIQPYSSNRYAYYATPDLEDYQIEILNDGSLLIYQYFYYEYGSYYRKKEFITKVNENGEITGNALVYYYSRIWEYNGSKWQLAYDDGFEYERTYTGYQPFSSDGFTVYEGENTLYVDEIGGGRNYYLLDRNTLELLEDKYVANGRTYTRSYIPLYSLFNSDNWIEEILDLYDKTGWVCHAKKYNNDDDDYVFGNESTGVLYSVEEGGGTFLPVKNNDDYFVFLIDTEYYSFPDSDYKIVRVCVAEKATGEIYSTTLGNGWKDGDPSDAFYKDGKIYITSFLGFLPTFDIETKTFEEGIINNSVNVATNDGNYLLSMWCDEDGYEEIEIYKITDTLTKLKDYASEYSENDLKYMVVVENNLLTYNQEYIDEVVTAFNAVDVKIIWIGKSGNQATGQALANGTGGLYINNTNLTTSFNTMQSYILSEIPEVEATPVMYKAKGEIIEYNKNYLDLENDPIHTASGELWRYTLDETKPNPDGVPSWNNTWLSSSLNSINYAGEYDIEYMVRDNPVGTDERFDGYRKWSIPKSARLIITDSAFLEAELVLNPYYPNPVQSGRTLDVTVITTSSKIPDNVDVWIEGGSTLELSKTKVSGNNTTWKGIYTVPVGYEGDYTFYARAYMDTLQANDTNMVRVVNNRPPTVTLTNLRPSFIYEGDNVNVNINMNDPDNDDLGMNVRVYKNGNLYSNDTQNISSTSYNLDYRLLNNAPIGSYTVSVTVTDPEGETASDSINFVTNELSITGQVRHTDKWNENRIKYNQYKTGTDNDPRSYDTFWAGERFMLFAETTNINFLSSVTVDSVNVEILNEGYSTLLNENNSTDWSGEISDTDMLYKWGQIEPEILVFRFTVSYSNGTIKSDDVNIIVDDIEKYWRLHMIN
jgi:hypothetical protein